MRKYSSRFPTSDAHSHTLDFGDVLAVLKSRAHLAETADGGGNDVLVAAKSSDDTETELDTTLLHDGVDVVFIHSQTLQGAATTWQTCSEGLA